jgi:DNA-binding Lrp family transcriptional regulator
MVTDKKLMLELLKDFTRKHTISSLAKELNLSRVGTWKILKKLEAEKYILIESVGSGKTSTSIIKINWDSLLVEKALALYLTEESIKQRRWRVNFAELEKEVDFLILYGSIINSPQQANDIDVLGIAKKNKFVKIQKVIDKIQKTESRKIHLIDFTGSEFRKELQNNNKAFIDAIKKGVILFGQEEFIKFMKNG